MPSLGDLAKSILGAVGGGIQHGRAMEQRGPDYRQRDAAALDQRMASELQRAGVLRGFEEQNAVQEALAELARRRGDASADASPVQGAAAYKAAVAEALNEIQRRQGAAQIKATEELAADRAGNEDFRRRMLQDKAAVDAALEQLKQGGRVALKKTVPGRAAGTGPAAAKVTPAEERKRATETAQIATLEAIESIPDEFLGPAGAKMAKVRGGLVGELMGMDEPSPERQNFQSAIQAYASKAVNELSGAAVSVPEMERLKQHIPDISQRPNTYRANVRMTKLGLEIAKGLREGTMTREKATAAVRQLLGGGAAPAAPNAAPAGGGSKSDPLGIL